MMCSLVPTRSLRSRLRVAFLLLTAAAGVSVSAAQGDQNPDITVTYPSAAFAPADIRTNTTLWTGNTTKILNVKTHFGATGDGNADDTQKFIDMFNFVAQREDDASQGRSITTENVAKSQWIMYVPAGTYKVSDTIQATNAYAKANPSNGYLTGIRLVGHNRADTKIVLVSGATGFSNAAAPKPVIAFNYNVPGDANTITFNNTVGHNWLRNLTVDVGSNNPGAVGVDFVSANTGRIDNVTIKSSDATWRGAIGLHFRIGIVHGYVSNLTVDGFDVGIKCVPFHQCVPALEHVTLTNQKKAAIQALDGGGSFRDVYSNQARNDGSPAADAIGILVGDDQSPAQHLGGSHVVVLDSTFASSRPGGSAQPAILIAAASTTDVDAGHVFARGIDVSGYAHSVQKSTFTLDGIITEYVSDSQIVTQGSSLAVSMGLPVEEAPFVAWESTLANWITAGAGDGSTDDTVAVQTAIDNNPNATVLYFPKQQYKITGTLTVPANIKRIDLMAAAFTGTGPTNGYFDVNAASATPLVIQDINAAVTASLVRVSADRVVVLESNRYSGVINNGTSGQRIYANNANKFLKFDSVRPYMLSNMKVWCRFLDTEDKDHANWTVGAGGVMWVLGFKCEGATVNYKVQSGGILEVLGGAMNQANGNLHGTTDSWDAFNALTPPNNAANINLASHLSFVGTTSGTADTNLDYPRRFDNLFGYQSAGGANTLFARGLFAPRWELNASGAHTARAELYVVPLFTSYVNAQIPRAPVFTADPIIKPDARVGVPYTGTLAGSATDVNGGTLTYSRLTGLSWLTIDPDGTLSGTPPASAAGPRTWTVQVTDSDGYSSTALLKLTIYNEVACPAVGAEDGYIYSSAEGSGVGGTTLNATGTGAAALHAGDVVDRRQVKSILSFDTSGVPAGATVIYGQLQLKVAEVVGTNPFLWPATCKIDIKSGSFGTNATLQSSDFQAASSMANVVTGGMPNVAVGAWSNGTLVSGALQYINTAKTQFRIYFSVDDNNNSTLDHVGWYSGEYTVTANRPVLVVRYY